MRSARPVILRASGGGGVGLGHLQRCLALASALPGGWRLSTSATPETLAALGVPADRVLAPGDWPADLPAGAPVVMDTLHHGNAAATAAGVAALKGRGHPVAVIDSMPPDHYEAREPSEAPDLLVTPYFGAEALRAAIEGTRWLVGADYAILPADLVAARAAARGGEGAEALLIATGGADPAGLAARVLAACAPGDYPIDVVVGPQFDPAHVATLTRLAAARPGATLHRGLASLLPLYLRARLVIGRPGLIRYEAACLGRPGLYLWERPEYHAYYRGLAERGVAEIHLAPTGAAGAFFDRVAERTADLDALTVPDARLMAMVDGQGAGRVAAALAQL